MKFLPCLPRCRQTFFDGAIWIKYEYIALAQGHSWGKTRKTAIEYEKADNKRYTLIKPKKMRSSFVDYKLISTYVLGSERPVNSSTL